MFKSNKYKKWYDAITIKGRVRDALCSLYQTIPFYKEKHHIIPQSLGGTNDKENLVYLTAREHFICHWLLVKMTEGEARSKMIYALQGMKAENKYQERYHTKITGRVYEKHRIEHAANHSAVMKAKNLIPWNKGGAVLSTDQRKRISEAAKNRPKPTKETIAKRSASVRGTKRSEETRLKMSLAAKGKPKGPQSEPHRLAISEGGKGIKKGKAHADNVRAAVMGNISINLLGEEKKVKKDTLQAWLSQGWALGGRPRSRKVARREV